ncbi:Bax inhibitor-1/YccA family protein [Niallia oryzisoli]|uniref:Bax inhibitor-1/YccA family protein n=1 Tax=Niallia oryzisoli TaxID=1737571 RepID=A0ABZ2CD61_9BACI
MYVQSANGYMPSVMRTFAISLAISFVGMVAGVFVPPALFLPLAILELVMILSAFLFRRKKSISYTFLYVFTFISGITTYPIVAYYLATAGANTVLMALGTTTAVFTSLAVYASVTKRDLSFLRGMLFAALIALIVIAIFNLIWPLSTSGMLAFSFISVLVFSGYVLYDFNVMKHYGFSAEEVPLMALNLYLDFINLFISILRIFGILSSDD